MSENVRLAPGTEWRDPWSGEQVRIIVVNSEGIIAEVLSTGAQRSYPDPRAFLDRYVAA